jgi:tetratricopeptide (TPR) repeat protein
MHMKANRRLGLLWLLLLGFPLAAEESLTRYYAFPLSIGAAYQSLGAVTELGGAFAITEISGTLRVPLPFAPSLRPSLRGGVVRFDSQDEAQLSVVGGTLDPGVTMPSYDARAVWDHLHAFAGVGLEYAVRISKEFEVGAEAFGGASLSYFPNRFITSAGEPYTVGQSNLYAGVGAKVTLNLSFSLSIDITPSFRYVRSLGSYTAFDGLLFGFGFAGSFRFGRDPDAPQAQVRALRFGEVHMPDMFAAMQSFYQKTPFAEVEIANTERDAVQDLEVAFFQAGYMDSPTPCARLTELAPGRSATVPLLAGYNAKVFEVEGSAPLTGELVATYTYRGRPVEQRSSLTYRLWDKNRLTWDDDRKVAALVTPDDSAVRNYASFIRTRSRNDLNATMPEKLQFAMQAFHALGSLGILYQQDPTSPFSTAQEDKVLVDTVSLPRETLKRITGDCDDLSVLYATLLECVSIDSAFVTVPGHIYCALNTGVPAQEYGRVHPDRGMLLMVGEEVWVPVEVTLIGRGSFLEAWETGIREWNAAEASARGFHRTREARELYSAVVLTQTDLGLQYGEPERFLAELRKDIRRLASLMLSPARDEASRQDTAKAWNSYGVTAARLSQDAEASEAFKRAIAKEPSYYFAQINLGSLDLMAKRYEQALESFASAEGTIQRRQGATDKTRSSLYVNLSTTHYQLEHYPEARSYYDKALALEPQVAQSLSYLTMAKSEGARADEVPAVERARFVEEE